MNGQLTVGGFDLMVGDEFDGRILGLAGHDYSYVPI